LKLSKPQKILLGILSIWPLVYIVFFVICCFVMNGHTISHISFNIIFVLHVLTMFLILAMIIFNIVHVLRTIKPPDDSRISWVIALLFGNMITNPVYWYLHIWREQKKEGTAPTPSA
jgi:hypothetical protein